MSEPHAPSVLAVVINFNYGAFLAECLDSIDSQTFDSVDILVVDDASTDDSLELLRNWSSLRGRTLHVMAKEFNCGPADSYNAALRFIGEHHYDFVGFLDADDLWEPDKTRRQVARFAIADDDVVVVYSDHADFGEGIERQSICADEPPNALEHLLRRGTFLALNSGLIRASAIVGLDPLGTDLRVCDLQLWLQLARRGRFVKVPEPLARVRIHGTSMRQRERLAGDRLTILGRHVRTKSERACARTRGRQLLRSYLAVADTVSLRPLVAYGRGCRDAWALPAAAIKAAQAARLNLRATRSMRK